MVSMGMGSIRVEISELSVEKSGWTTLFVDAAYAAASDHNDGYSWSRPKKTIGGALTIAEPWTKIYVRTGTYNETLLVDQEHVQLIGVIEDGPNVAKVVATGGAALEVTAGFCEVSGLAIDADGQHGIKATMPGQKFRNLALDIKNTTGSNINGIWLHDADKAIVENCYLNGNSSAEVIGILVGDDTVDADIKNNYITGCGDGMGAGCGAGGVCGNNGYAIGIDDNAQRVRIHENILINNCVGVYFYKTGAEGYKGHSVIHNSMYENCNYDVYDQYDPDHATTPSGISIRENFYGYLNWYSDDNRDGRANYIVDCGTNYDHAPLANPRSWETAPVPRSNIQ
jgi:hypothetical protein